MGMWGPSPHGTDICTSESFLLCTREDCVQSPSQLLNHCYSITALIQKCNISQCGPRVPATGSCSERLLAAILNSLYSFSVILLF